ncbi:MAG: hypothetical protein GOMPHAMPRED_003885 [Gomphillus americanus]|uniref:Uncharacterized protein n=1 Tax=Gomphillus americanus TaxID=1940652 RepID=A0A8H3FJ40_9LECA|nr:MAG: hypothetical protein GOMPHAMPRED_003885 [Gomphillus americanus]
MFFPAIIVLIASSLTRAHPENDKTQALFVRSPIQPLHHNNADSFLHPISANEIGWASLWRRGGSRSRRKSSKPSEPQSPASPPASAHKPDANTPISDASVQQRNQATQSRPAIGTRGGQSDTKLSRSSSLANYLDFGGKPFHPEPAQSGIDRSSEGAQSKSASPKRPSSSDHRVKSVDMSGVVVGPAYAERIKNKAAIRAAHISAMESASRGILAANTRAALLAREGKHEPPRPAENYQALKDAKAEFRRTQRDINEKTDIAGKALTHGSAIDPATIQKFHRADDAIVKADKVAYGFVDAHGAAAISAIDQRRWSDFGEHIKNERKSVARSNANKAYHGAMKAAQQDRYNAQQVSKLGSKDPAMTKFFQHAIADRKEFEAAKEHYSMMYHHYQDARQRFPDSSSSEDEEKTFP